MAQPEASAAPAAVLPPEAVAVRYALPAAVEAAWRVSAAAGVRQPAAVAALRAQVAAVAGQAAAEELPREAAAVVPHVPGAAEGVARRAGAAAVPQPAEVAPRDVARQRAVQPSAEPWVFHPDRHLPWPAPPPSERFARAMKAQRIALP